MKQSLKFYAIRSFFFLLFLNAFQLVMLAQEQGGESQTTTSSTSKTTKIDITTSNQNNDWYSSPWVWVVGAAVFILLLVALLSNRGSDRVVRDTSDNVIVKKTVERDSDIV